MPTVLQLLLFVVCETALYVPLFWITYEGYLY